MENAVGKGNTSAIIHYMVLILVTTLVLRYVMIVGMTGAGKSLLINNIINFIYGVD